ncbi:hypothetical protein COR50_01385 [Chitinophaga caeni]|uniref:DUF5008 domain-containing protein n=1 Tax=Chitinophaga caeni TaxID=2029983 RepID=A0A291QPQ6_9BACT|nr:DUF5008 domain-containing protein [Chitinophaga caeni]ATL45921.1 hypothetical protein COR50_01385 [Chitinophaga caeni]
MQLSKYFILVLLVAMGFLACKETETVYPDPYAGGLPPLGIAFDRGQPTPAEGGTGDIVTFKVTGLLPYKDSVEFYMGDQLAEVTNIGENSVSLKVPPFASSGAVTVKIGDELLYTPVFTVKGKLKIDRTFLAGRGANGAISSIVPTSNNRYLLVGAFTQYNAAGVSNPLYGITMTETNGAYVSAFGVDSAVGATGIIRHAAQLPNGKILIGGSFSRYGSHTSLISGITAINQQGYLDTMIVNVIPTEDDIDAAGEHEGNAEVVTVDTVPAFNAGFTGSINRIYYHDEKVYVVGNFYVYQQVYYPNSTRYTKVSDYRQVSNIARMDINGNLDSTFHYDLAEHKGKQGVIGNIGSSYMTENGQLILVGRFTSYDGTPTGNIVRLDENGDMDPTFMAGTGTNGVINSITYNATTKKYVITGLFDTYNGQPRKNMAVLNEDGSLDANFIPQAVTGGVIVYAKQMSNGYIITTGTFQKYGDVTRYGLMVLNPDGTLSADHNNTGKFNGIVTDMVETVSAEGDPAMILVGFIQSFDNSAVGNIVRLVFER